MEETKIFGFRSSLTTRWCTESLAGYLEKMIRLLKPGIFNP